MILNMMEYSGSSSPVTKRPVMNELTLPSWSCATVAAVLVLAKLFASVDIAEVKASPLFFAVLFSLASFDFCAASSRRARAFPPTRVMCRLVITSRIWCSLGPLWTSPFCGTSNFVLSFFFFFDRCCCFLSSESSSSSSCAPPPPPPPPRCSEFSESPEVDGIGPNGGCAISFSTS